MYMIERVGDITLGKDRRENNWNRKSRELKVLVSRRTNKWSTRKTEILLLIFLNFGRKSQVQKVFSTPLS